MATNKNNSVTNGTIYELVNNTRIELKSDIIRLETKFDNLEAGRLTRAEAAISKLQVKDATFSVKLAVLGFMGSSLVGAITTAAIYKIAGVH